MLDADLAEIYGYSTKRFNEQVKNNIAKFDEDFRFQLNNAEISLLSRSKISTSMQVKGVKGGRSYKPYAFTEQGIYMLMTVLKGEQATAQSKALIRLFKQMKDYIAAENAPDVSAGMIALATQTSQNTRDIAEIAADVRSLSNKVERNESFLQRCRQQDYDHHAAGRYRSVSPTVREVVARRKMRTQYLSKKEIPAFAGMTRGRRG